MSFVKIEKNKKSVPSDEDIKKAMQQVGGDVQSIEGDNAEKKVIFTGEVNHTRFQNTLEEVAKGNKLSWNYTWADSMETEANTYSVTA